MAIFFNPYCPFALRKCNLTRYADNTSMSYASKNIEALNTVINRDLDNVATGY